MPAGARVSARRRWAAALLRPRCLSCQALMPVGVQGLGLRAHAPGHVLGRVTGTTPPAPAAAGQHPLRMRAVREKLTEAQLQLAAAQDWSRYAADLVCNMHCTGASLFGGAATTVLSGSEAGRRAEALDSRTLASGGSSRKQSPNVAEKAAAHMAALLPDFRPKETVNEFLSEVHHPC
jgi:hypothetical protein